MALRSECSSHPALSCADRLAASTSDIVLLIGRILLGWIFVRSGYGKLFNVEAVANSFPLRGLPAFLAYIAVPVEFFGGLALMFGLATRYVVLVMVIFMLVATFSSHRYWAVEPAQVANQSSHFWKNVTIKGGLVLLFITGAGRYALDRLLARK